MNPKIIVCIPGNNFSGTFLDCYTNFIGYCLANNIQFLISRHYSPVIYYARNMCLGGDTLKGINQKPFQGQIDYTHLLWIDSDIVFTPEHFKKLLNHNQDIVSGLYLMENQTQYATVKDWNEEYFKKNGTFEFLSPKDIANQTNLIDVSYTGFGFILIKKGVFENLQYPWFKPIFHNIGNSYDFSSEDVSVCKLLKSSSYKILVDPTVIVGHEKKLII